jgi:hypothetical protein
MDEEYHVARQRASAALDSAYQTGKLTMEKRMSADIPGSTTSAPSDPNPAPGLPPVVPPSGRHIVQMFLVPGFIVAAVVLVLLFFTWLQSGHSDASGIIANLDAANAEVRWRAANDLTQRLKRDDNLAASPQLSLRLCELLQKRLEEYDQAVKAPKDRSNPENRKELLGHRKDVQFLVACVGNLMVPTGSELLSKVLSRPGGSDEDGRILLRREAVWAMSNLGNNLAKLKDLSSDRRVEIISGLQAESAAGGDRKRWADVAIDYLQALQDGKQPSSHGVVEALAAAADNAGPDSDVFLRELVGHALNFWHGDDKEEKLIDATLVKLAHDNGEGKVYQLEDND